MTTVIILIDVYIQWTISLFLDMPWFIRNILKMYMVLWALSKHDTLTV